MLRKMVYFFVVAGLFSLGGIQPLLAAVAAIAAILLFPWAFGR